MVWNHNKDGNYSVKSGYWLATQIFRKDQIQEAAALPTINRLNASVWRIEHAPS